MNQETNRHDARSEDRASHELATLRPMENSGEFSGSIQKNDPLILAGHRFISRLLVGTGKYKDMRIAKAALEASGAEIVTAAIRRIRISGNEGESITDVLDTLGCTILPNSSGAYTAEDAIRLFRLAHELGGWKLIKLEIVTDEKTLLPNTEETLRATKMLAKEGFHVMAYTDDDFDMARKLEDAGCAAVMPLAAPIGSGLGIRTPEKIRRIAEALACPVLVDAGIGTASDATLAMELGCAGVLLNTAIAEAKDPLQMARAFKHAVEAGRLAHLAGRMQKRDQASASSPKEGKVA